MYKTIIVDDEYNICNLIEALIDYERTEVLLDRKFTDGRECLEYIRHSDVDIVICDIQMEEMTGLDLLKEVRSFKPEIRFIIISGFNYFDFARQALQYGADNYLLKPINRDELNNTICRVVEKINSDRGMVNEMKQAQEQLHSQAQELFAIDFFKNECKDFRPEKMVQDDYGICFPYDSFMIGILHVDIAPGKYYVDSLLLTKAGDWIRNRSLEQGYCVFSMTEGNNRYFLFHFPKNEEKKLCSCLRVGIAQLQGMYGGDQNLVFSMGLSELFEWEESHKTAFSMASAGIQSRLFLTGKNVITPQMIGYGEFVSSEPNEFETIRKRISWLIDVMDFSGLTAFVDEVFKKICETHGMLSHKGEQIAACLQILSAKITSVTGRAVMYDETEFDVLRSNFRNLNEYYIRYRKTAEDMIRILDINADKTDRWAVASVKNYIQEHYAEKISMEKAAEEVHLSPAYLGTLFKNTSGETVSEYLTKVRIDKAKELLRESSYNISEIADMVGYSDAKYFTKTFKKEIGVKPTEYRNVQARLGRR